MAIQFLTADQVAEAIGVSRSTAYRIIKRLNQELENKGYMADQSITSCNRCSL